MSRVSIKPSAAQIRQVQLVPLDHSERPSIGRLAVTVEEAARLLGVGRATLYKLVMRGDIESFTIGRARRIAITSLEQYTRSHRVISVRLERGEEV